MMPYKKILDLTLGSILVILLLWVLFSLFQGNVLVDLLISNPQGFKDYIISLGVWSEIAYVGSVMLEVLIAFIPGWFIYPVGGAIFGFYQTLWLVLLGNFLAASISFWIGRKWGQPLLKKFIAPKYTAFFEQYMQTHGSISIFLLKLNPMTSFDLWNYIAGASRISYIKFSVANLLGILPLVVLSTFFGEEIYTVAPQILAVLFVLTIVYVAWFLVNLPKKISKYKRDP